MMHKFETHSYLILKSYLNVFCTEIIVQTNLSSHLL